MQSVHYLFTLESPFTNQSNDPHISLNHYYLIAPTFFLLSHNINKSAILTNPHSHFRIPTLINTTQLSSKSSSQKIYNTNLKHGALDHHLLPSSLRAALSNKQRTPHYTLNPQHSSLSKPNNISSTPIYQILYLHLHLHLHLNLSSTPNPRNPHKSPLFPLRTPRNPTPKFET